MTKNPNGTYHFSWLHVDTQTGYIVDANNCIVDLRGFNTSGTEYSSGVDSFLPLSPIRLTWFNRMFHMNYIRLNLNVGWWNNNVYVPVARMHYKAWIERIIKWAKSNGDYVLLTRTNEYTLPPCGGTITYCPHQAEAADVNDGYPQAQFDAGHLFDQTLPFWQSITSLYRNDPAILYNDWNELHDINAATWFQIQTTLITTIRSINPRALIMVGSNDWNGSFNIVLDGETPDLNYPNLVYDWHIYDGQSGPSTSGYCQEPDSYVWANWAVESARQFSFAQIHGHGAIIDEWGGCINDPTYSNTLSSFAASNHIGMAYYWAGNVVNDSWTALNSNGVLAQAAYAKFTD